MDDQNLIISKAEMSHVNLTLYSARAILGSIGENAVSLIAGHLIYGADQCLTNAISNTEKFLTAAEKTAKWTADDSRPDTVVCSNCDSSFDVMWMDKGSNFCPNCGAKMILD